MKKIGFIGAFDKADLILYTAKIFVELGKKVMVVDTTITQKMKYTVPCIAPSKMYITQHENIDVAVGFESMQDIVKYIGSYELEYDYIFFDIDSNMTLYKMELNHGCKNYFVTGFDNYSLKKGLDVIGRSQDKIMMTKIMFSKNMTDEENDYLDFLSFYYGVSWEKTKIYFPFEIGDSSVIIENQRSARIRFKDLSMEYLEGLFILANNIAPELKKNDIRKILKNM